MVAAVSPCLSGICDPTNISYFFTRYLKETATQFGLQLPKMLRDWIKLFEKLNSILVAIKSSSQTVATNVASVSSKVRTTQKAACTGKLCVGPGISGFNKKGIYRLINYIKMSTNWLQLRMLLLQRRP